MRCSTDHADRGGTTGSLLAVDKLDLALDVRDFRPGARVLGLVGISVQIDTGPRWTDDMSGRIEGH